VVLALPEDMLTAQADVPDARRYQPVQAAPSPAQITQLREMLAAAKQPVVLLGGAGWHADACDDIRRFAERNALPVACAFRFQDLLDNRHPQYIGDVGIGINPKLAARIKSADLVIAIGPRLGEMTTGGYTLLDAPVPKQKLVHVHASAEELGRVYQADLMINSGMPQIAAALADMEPVDASAWRHTAADARAELAAWQEEPPIFKGSDAALNLWQVVQTVKAALPPDTILTNGAGNFATWAHRFWHYGGFRTQLAPTSGAMGYGVPAAVAAKIAAPHRTVLNFAGDGDFMMNGQELATAVQHRAGVLFIVFNNGAYGTIRMHQEREYPGRVSGTALQNPDFAALAQAYGAFGESVETTARFPLALERAQRHIAASGLPALIELRYDADFITPNASLATIRQASLAARSR
jgi:acetolactate synthase-1/2/3 large subunit